MPVMQRRECFGRGLWCPFVLYLHTSAMSANAAMASQAEAAAQASGESGVCGNWKGRPGCDVER